MPLVSALLLYHDYMAKIRQNALGKRRQIPIRRSEGIPVPRKGEKSSPQVISGRPELSDLEPISFENGDAPTPLPPPPPPIAVSDQLPPPASLLETIDIEPAIEYEPEDVSIPDAVEVPANTPALRDSVVMAEVAATPGNTKAELTDALQGIHPFKDYPDRATAEREVYASLVRLRTSDKVASSGPPRNRIWSPA